MNEHEKEKQFKKEINNAPQGYEWSTDQNLPGYPLFSEKRDKAFIVLLDNSNERSQSNGRVYVCHRHAGRFEASTAPQKFHRKKKRPQRFPRCGQAVKSPNDQPNSPLISSRSNGVSGGSYAEKFKDFVQKNPAKKYLPE